MKIKSIQLEETPEGSLPSEITVTMNIVEAAQIAQIFGQFSDTKFSEFNWPITEMYEVLCSDVFNRFWEDGVDDVLPKIGAVKW